MKKVVLFVDDDGDDVELTLMGFKQLQFEEEIVVARDGVEALTILEKSPAPAVVLTDIKMPRMDGLELLRRIKQDPRLKDIPVALLTSSGHEEDRKAAMKLGAVTYMRKPSSLNGYSEVVDALRDLLK